MWQFKFGLFKNFYCCIRLLVTRSKSLLEAECVNVKYGLNTSRYVCEHIKEKIVLFFCQLQFFFKTPDAEV